jgi:hypothetical protein
MAWHFLWRSKDFSLIFEERGIDGFQQQHMASKSVENAYRDLEESELPPTATKPN